MTSRMIRIYCDDKAAEKIGGLTPTERAAAMVAEAERRDGTLYRRLVADLSDRTEQALLIAPAFIGGDTSDWDVFLTEVWQRPVTEENHREVAQLFRQWYALVAPDEYHDPRPLRSMFEHPPFSSGG